MATQPELTAVANALAAALQSDITQMVPSWAMGFIPQNEADILGGQLSAIAINTLDDFRAAENAPPPPPNPGATS